MTNPRQALLAGVHSIVPILLGVIPFGLIAGAATVAVGLSAPSAIGMSVLIFAGMSQLATVELLGQSAPWLVIIATALVVNLRFMMYSAALAPHLGSQPARWKVPLAYLLTDQAYVMSAARFPDLEVGDRRWFYLGAALTLWVAWQTSFGIGALLGARVPPEWSLDFAVPLTLLALIPSTVRDRAALVTLGATAAAVWLFHALPLNLGVIVSVAVGVGAGWLWKRRMDPGSRPPAPEISG